MKKIYGYVFLLTLLLTVVLPLPVFGQEDAFDKFQTNSNVTYTIQSDGTTNVEHDITITNLKSDLIVSSYSIELKEDVSDVSGKSKGRKVEVAKTNEDGITKLTARFGDFVIGQDKKNDLKISYTSKKTATKIGNIWNINIPRIGEKSEKDDYNTTLIVPEDLGPKLYISPLPDKEEKQGKNTVLFFGKEKIVKNGITASYGTYQQINFRLLYQLQNDNFFKSSYEVAFPPEIQGLQQIKYISIKPEPKKIKVDDQGNTVATYELKSKAKMEVELIGNARISGRQIEPSNGGIFRDIPSKLKIYTQESKYWDINSESIKSLVTNLKDENLTVAQNALKIYDYILENYHYDFSIQEKKGLDRKGAEKALLDKNSWGCMEFTDLFITVARAMGIPARQLNGYALTKDEENKPLSVILNGGDRLHAWPEFYDPAFGWVQIDPTWGSTSGIDYFTKLDTNHFVFVIRGTDSEYPMSAGEYRYDQDKKLVEVEFPETTSLVEFSPEFEMERKLSFNPIAWIKKQTKYSIKNTGDVFIYLKNGKAIAPNDTNTIYLPQQSKTIQLSDFSAQLKEYPIN
ncbi:transglutaminase domain-containing protein [candidate division WWE3 bacterium]|uniref:Transglutaminase domain-containing protein n=1 Tax=candidate division WWE3 bacterium TaxID=2053526 RepID=A0A7X9HGU3_UNCKA|nr:transglutaminase domain-containing protein [candidate division WWE3 bacterium]